MTTVYLSPIFNNAQLDNSGNPLTGGKLYWYEAGTSTPSTTYTSHAGSTPQANPIILNSRGEPANPIWLISGQSYKAVLKSATDVVIRTVDNIDGINDIPVSTAPSEWVLYDATATYLSSTSFSVAGNHTDIFSAGRRVKLAVTAGTCYATITDSVYSSSVTTVTTSNDSTAIDSGLSSVYYGIISLSSDPKTTNAYEPLIPFRIIAGLWSSPPDGYLELNGAAISRDTYAVLFSHIGTRYGVGDGSTTFNLPVMAAGETLIAAAGSALSGATSSIGEVISHHHSVAIQGGGYGAPNGSPTPELTVEATSIATSDTGGAKNLAAGLRVMFCINYG